MIVAASLIAAAPVMAAAQKAPAAAVVTADMQRVSQECTACKGAQAALQGQITSLQQRAQALKGPLDAEANAIRTTLGDKQPDPAMQKRIDAFQQKQANAQQELQGREQAIGRNRAYVAQQIQAKLGPIYQSVMVAHGANIMVDTQATLAAASTLDVTGDILTQLNQQLPSVSATAPAAPAGQGR